MTKKTKVKNQPAPWFTPIAQPFTSRPVIEILRHEAGHMVVAKLLGFETGDVMLTATQAGAWFTPAPQLTDIPSVIDYMERRVPVLYAGCMGEALQNGDINNETALAILKDYRGSDDFSKTKELLHFYTGLNRGNREAEEVHQKNADRLWFRAGTLVKKYQSEIIAISKEWRSLVGGRSEMTIRKADTAKIEEFARLSFGGEVAAMASLEPADGEVISEFEQK